MGPYMMQSIKSNAFKSSSIVNVKFVPQNLHRSRDISRKNELFDLYFWILRVLSQDSNHWSSSEAMICYGFKIQLLDSSWVQRNSRKSVHHWSTFVCIEYWLGFHVITTSLAFSFFYLSWDWESRSEPLDLCVRSNTTSRSILSRWFIIDLEIFVNFFWQLHLKIWIPWTPRSKSESLILFRRPSMVMGSIFIPWFFMDLENFNKKCDHWCTHAWIDWVFHMILHQFVFFFFCS